MAMKKGFPRDEAERIRLKQLVLGRPNGMGAEAFSSDMQKANDTYKEWLDNWTATICAETNMGKATGKDLDALAAIPVDKYPDDDKEKEQAKAGGDAFQYQSFSAGERYILNHNESPDKMLDVRPPASDAECHNLLAGFQGGGSEDRGYPSGENGLVDVEAGTATTDTPYNSVTFTMKGLLPNSDEEYYIGVQDIPRKEGIYDFKGVGYRVCWIDNQFNAYAVHDGGDLYNIDFKGWTFIEGAVEYVEIEKEPKNSHWDPYPEIGRWNK